MGILMLLYTSYEKALQCWNQCGMLEMSEHENEQSIEQHQQSDELGVWCDCDNLHL
jgi:hypothetical protein